MPDNAIVWVAITALAVWNCRLHHGMAYAAWEIAMLHKRINQHELNQHGLYHAGSKEPKERDQ